MHDLHALRGDRPLGEADPDQLGFRPLARRLAKALTDKHTAGGLVVGVEGRWGSGKSSLLNLITFEIGALAPKTKLVDYRPWLVSDRDALLASLFDELALAVEAAQSEKGDVQSAVASKARRAADGLRGFAKKVSKLGPLASVVAGMVPGAGPVVDVIRKIAEDFASMDSTPLSELKETLARQLADLGTRIVVTIDDVDRLEPKEVVELLRLVRAVADFPNVTYVLCFDSDVLAQNVQTALGIADGHAFIEKIVQIVVPVPTPEAFDLRHWFATDLGALVGPLARKQRQSLDRAVDIEGGRRLTTPRAVVRVLDALRLKLSALKNEVDVGDLVWLELIKVDNLPLYRWIEAYSSSHAAMWPGRVQVTDEVAGTEFATLQKHLANDGLTFEQVEWELDDRLLGIGHMADRKLFVRVQNGARAAAIRDRRLASPDHHRLYFALSAPRNAPTSTDLEAFEAAATKSAEKIAALLVAWLELTQTNGVSKSEVALSRLDSNTLSVLGSRFRENLLFAFSDMLDVTAAKVAKSPVGSFALWHEAGRLWPLLIRESSAPRDEIISMFEKGKALGWLTDLFRDECFAYGRTGEPPRGGANLSPAELDIVIPLMIERYRALGVNGILKSIDPMNFLFAWYQAGDQERVRAEVAKATKADAALTKFLENLTGTATSSVDGERTTLSKSSIETFFDYDALVARLEHLAAGASKNGKRAKTMLGYIASADRF